jgi:hypothetical protein
VEPRNIFSFSLNRFTVGKIPPWVKVIAATIAILDGAVRGRVTEHGATQPTRQVPGPRGFH